MNLVNQTPYLAERTMTMSRSAAEMLVVSVKGTWRFASDGLKRADDPAPFVPADEYAGKPGESSIVRENELGPPRPATCVAVTGSVKARRGVREAVVSLHAGSIRKSVRVVGRRRWWSLFGFARLTRPEPIGELPLIWEHAYGGVDEKAKAWETRNPIGRGFKASRGMKWKGTDAPNLENPARPLRQPGKNGAPWNLGFVSPHWEPRRSRAGTHDETWEKEVAPLLPEDFDDAFLNSVPDDQVSPRRFTGGEPVEVVGAGPGPLRGELTREFPVASVVVGRDLRGLALPLDVVTVDLDAGALTLIWKGWLDVHGESFDVSEVRVSIAASRRSAG